LNTLQEFYQCASLQANKQNHNWHVGAVTSHCNNA